MIIFDLFEDNNKKSPGVTLAEFAPSDSNNGDDGFSEETLKQLAAQWYNGDEDPEVERTLEVAGWEIGQVEDDDEPGVFVVLAGDINGNSYIQWTEDELRQGVAEGEHDAKFRDDEDSFYHMADFAHKQIRKGQSLQDVVQYLRDNNYLEPQEVNSFVKQVRGEKWNESVTENQYEIHHLDPEGRRKAIYHHGRGYTDDVVRKDTQYHQERNPRDTFRVFKDKQPFDWQGMAEAEVSGRVDPILIKALNRMPDGLATHGQVLDAAYDAYAMELGKMAMRSEYGVTNVYIPKLLSLYKDKHGLTFNETQDMAESLRPGEYHVWTVHFDDGTKGRIRVPSDEYDDDLIKAHYARKGKQVVKIDYDWAVHNDLDEGWRSTLGAAALAGTMALGAGNAHGRVAGDYVDNPDINRLTGKPKVTQTAPSNQVKPVAPSGFSSEYLQSVVDGTHPRPMISVEKAQELLNQIKEGEVTKTATGIRHRSTDAYGGTKDTDHLRTLDKSTTNKIDRALGVKFNREKKWGAGLDLDENTPKMSAREKLQRKIDREKKQAQLDRTGLAGMDYDQVQRQLRGIQDRTSPKKVNEVSPEYIERFKKEHGRRATAADQAGDYAKGHEHFKKINKLTKQQFQRGNKPEKVDEISNFMTQPTKPVSAEEQWKRQIRLLAKQYQTNAGSLAALARENGADSAEAVAYEYLRDPSKIRVPGITAPASAVNWDEVIRRLPMGLSGMALLQAAEEYLINNRGMLRSTVRSLLNNDENQRTLSAAYAKKKTPAESVTEESDNEAVEQAIARRIMVGRTDLLLKYGPRKVMQAVEEVADYVGAVDEIGSSDVSGWVAQVERTLGGMSEAKATSTRLDPKCWTGKKIGNPKTKVKGGVRVNNCVPAESVAEDLTEEFNLIESIIELLAEHNGVDAEVIWEDLETLTEDELYVFAVTSKPIMESQGVAEDWQKANKRDKTDGMSQKAVNAYRRENPGSKLKTAVTTKPSKLKKGSKASKRRKSYCSRSKGQMNMHNISCAKTPDKAICKARRRWNC